MPDFRRDLNDLINRHNLEANSGTPDFILTEFLLNSLKAFDSAVSEREKWYHGPDSFSEAEDESV
jgi:hypothetical protein